MLFFCVLASKSFISFLIPSVAGRLQQHILLGWVATVDVISDTDLVFKCLRVGIIKKKKKKKRFVKKTAYLTVKRRLSHYQVSQSDTQKKPIER